MHKNTQVVKKVRWKSCEIQGGGQEIAGCDGRSMTIITICLFFSNLVNYWLTIISWPLTLWPTDIYLV